MTIRKHPVIYSTALVLCALFGVAMVMVGLDSASAQKTSVLEWSQHVHSASNIADWDGDIVLLELDRPHNYTVSSTRTSLLISATVSIDAGTAGPLSRQFTTTLNGTILPYCRIHVQGDGSGTVNLQGIESIYGGSRCPTFNSTKTEQFNHSGANNFTFTNSGSAGVTFVNINVYLLVQDGVVIPNATTENGTVNTLTLLEDATGLAGIDYIALFAIIVAAMIVWSRAHDDGVRWFTGLFCMIPGVALLAVSTMAGGDWIFIPIIGAAFIMLGGYLWIKQAFEHLGSTSIQ